MGNSEANNVKNPLVTIFALSYNTGKYVIQALDCIKRQTYKNTELIIIDDVSSDNSVELIDEWIRKNNYPCTFIKHTKNLGTSANSNEALGKANGKYICDIGDDLWEDNRIEEQLRLFNNDDTIAFVCGNSKRIDENNNYLGTFFPTDYELPDNVYLSLLSFDKGVIFCTTTMMYNTEILRQEGGFSTQYLQEDYYILLTLTKKNKIVFKNNFLVSYRLRHDSLGRSIKWLVRLKKDTLHLLMDIKPDNTEEKNAIKRGILNVLKSNYYSLNTSELDQPSKEDLYQASSEAIKFLRSGKFSLTFYERIFLVLMIAKIPYKFSFKFFKTLNPEFKL